MPARYLILILAALSLTASQARAQALSVTISNPTDGQVIWGIIEVQGTSTGAVSVLVKVDNGTYDPATGTDNWTYSLDASTLGKRHHTITAQAQNGTGGSVTAIVYIIANNQSPPAPDCPSLIPGTPLPYNNPSAPTQLELGSAATIYLEIIGHSENRGYNDDLQAMLDANPPGQRNYVVTNHWIGGCQTFSWVTPGSEAYLVIEDIINNIQGPTIALILTSNNLNYPIQSPTMANANYARFVNECNSLADHLYNNGTGAVMCYFSAHRMKPKNLMPCYNENLAMADVMTTANSTGKDYIKCGPEQHNLHWCCYPYCYDSDFAHTNNQGDALMAEAWFNLLSQELTFSTVIADYDNDGDVDHEDFGRFQTCYTGTGNPPPPGCDNRDLDNDDDVDLEDFDKFMQCVSGPNVPVNLNCLN